MDIPALAVDLKRCLDEIFEISVKDEYEEKLRAVYRVPITGPIAVLQEQFNEINVALPIKEGKQESISDQTLVMRAQLKELLKDPLSPEKKITIAKWIVETWGGIRPGKNNDSLNGCISKAEQADDGGGKFDFERIPSWSKYLAFKKPEKYAIYDARVIYSLNWLLFRCSSNKYFPFLPGENNVTSLLNYQLYLYLTEGGRNSELVVEALRDDIKKRRSQSVEEQDSKKTNNSYFSSGLNRKLDLFIPTQDAFKNYCALLKAISEKLYPNCANGLTKTEMLLFAIADAEISESVLLHLSGMVKKAGEARGAELVSGVN